MAEVRREALSIVEEAYDLDVTNSDWLRRVTTSISRDISGPLGTIGYFFDRDVAGYMTGPAHVSGGDPSLIETTRQVLRCFPTWDLERFFNTAGLRTSRELCATPIPDNPYRVSDFRGVVFGDSARGVTIGTPLVDPVVIHESTRRRWFGTCRHLTTALHLRDALRAELSVGEQDGALESESGAQPQSAEASSPRASEPLRKLVMESGEHTTLKLWRELISGRWTLIERFDGSHTSVIGAHANGPDATELRALTPSENLLVKCLVGGMHPAAAARRCNISRAGASQTLYRALAKLRIESVAALTLLAATLRDRPVHFVNLRSVQLCVAIADGRPSTSLFEPLSPCEVEIARYLLRGLTLAEVAARRGRAVRTVANQVASMYRKLGISSRAELGMCIHAFGLQ